MTHLESLKLVAILIATFPSAKIEPAALDEQRRPIPNTGTAATYARLLADLDADAVAAAIDRVAATHRFPTVLPAIAEIREAAFALTVGEVAPGGAAWGAIRKLLHATREHRGYSAGDPPPQSLVERVAGANGWRALEAIGGWRALCCTEEDDPAPRSQFVRAYDVLAATSRRDDVSRALPAVRKFHELRGADVQRQIAATREPTKPTREIDANVRTAQGYGRNEVHAGDVAALLLQAAGVPS